MNLDHRRSRLVKFYDMDFFWVMDHYDVHLSGLCWHKKRLHFFEIESDFFALPHKDIEYRVYQLGFRDKLKLRLDKLMFEVCVSTNWSYPPKEGRSLNIVWLNKALHNFYYYVWSNLK